VANAGQSGGGYLSPSLPSLRQIGNGGQKSDSGSNCAGPTVSRRPFDDRFRKGGSMHRLAALGRSETVEQAPMRAFDPFLLLATGRLESADCVSE
jgi:hypothetical protein